MIPFLALDSSSSLVGNRNVNMLGVANGCVKACVGGLGRKNFLMICAACR